MDIADTYLDTHFNILEGRKVILLPFTASDITTEYMMWLNDPTVVRYSNQRFRQHSWESCQDYLASFKGSTNRLVKVIRRTDGITIGTMTTYASVHHRTVDMGIMLGNRSCWGHGLGQDAWDTLLNWLLKRESVRKVTAGAMRCNIAMVHIMERSGMTLEAVRPQQELLEGVAQDLVFYGRFCAD
jgi:RimJ/RimL family protein N-acetyltransferase